jgi:CheY-like chemotaxis protein
VASVLVVDDEIDGSDVVVRYLEKMGHSTRCVPNGREALAAIISDTPDVVVLDLRMPEMDGITFLEVIRCYLRWSFLPVIILTALQAGSITERAQRMGVRHIFHKAGYRLSDLAAAVDECARQPHDSVRA